MDLNFSKEDLAFRDEVKEFLDKEYPKHIKQKMENGDELSREEIVEWHKCVAKKGWMGHSWPVEHGGTGSSAAAPIAKKVIKKVLDRHKLRMSNKNMMGKEI